MNNNKINFTQEELQMLNIACLSYSEKLSAIIKSIPFEKNTDGLDARAKEFWELGVKIAGYMED